MRIFASEKVSALMQKLGMEKGEAIEHNWVNKAISNAQKKVEGHNFDIRKHLLDYDNVANEQRKHIYNKRNEFLDIKNRQDIIGLITEEVFIDLIEANINLDASSSEIDDILQRDFNIQLNTNEIIKKSLKKEEVTKTVLRNIYEIHEKNIKDLPGEVYLEITKEIYINIIDKSWVEHIQSMDYLRQGIGLRSYAQKNPKQEYKREAFDMFSIMQNNIHYSFISLLFRLDYKTSLVKKEPPIGRILEKNNEIGELKKTINKNAQKRSRKLKKKRRK
jgi:preprotein translocase subunit SecA